MFDFPYQPPRPRAYRPKIALIGCGSITKTHLAAYVKQGYEVVALCDAYEPIARERAAQFYPDAAVYARSEDVFERADVDVVDLATHPQERAGLIRASLEAGKHVLSQKPFVTDLALGRELCDLADARGLKLAVNQNGRWAPHWSWIRAAVAEGAIGDLTATHLRCSWDHSFIKGTPFERMEDVILYDYAIHWFDFLNVLWRGRDWKRVCAIKTHVRGQEVEPPMSAQVLVEWEGGAASLLFDATVRFGGQDTTFVAGTRGTLASTGPHLNAQTVSLSREGETFSPTLEGAWFPDGFAGSIGELLCAIEEDREPGNSGRDNLRSLELTFAAIASAFDGQSKVPGEVGALDPRSVPAQTARV